MFFLGGGIFSLLDFIIVKHMLFQSKAEDAPMTHPDRDARMLNELLRTVVALRNVGEARRFFRDLLTDDELDMISRRWRVVHLLAEGVPYREIERRTGMSSRTVARIARWYKDGPGGYRLALTRERRGRESARQ
jgi:TrpR-related protein YerC/YecD